MDKSGQLIRECLHSHDLRSLDTPTMVQDGPLCSSSSTEPLGAAKPIPVRSSARVSKKAKLDLLTKNGKEEKGKTVISPVNISSNIEGKRKRNWGLWSVEDKNTFFEALNEFGKDFDAIQSHFASKIKKRGVTEAKNKDQVRHFYYRNWHKISKFIDFNPDLGKVNQELFGLINYGELRKRLGRSVLDKNVIIKLHELIYEGTTQIKVKGKSVRVKTPSCRALRKLGQIDNVEDAPKLPLRVNVELRPLNNRTWGIVHSKAHNPRVSTTQSLQHKLTSLILYLQNRWQSRDSKILDKLATAGEANVQFPRQTMKLRLAPKAGVKISVPLLNVNESTTTNAAISLKSLEDRLISIRKSGSNKAGKGSCTKGRNKKKNADGEKSADPLNAGMVEKILALQLEGEDATDFDLKQSLVESSTKELEPQEKKVDSHAEQLEIIKAGWTLENASNLTLGELYVMFGSDSKLCFEYSWEEIPPIAAVNGVERSDGFSSVIKRLANLAKLLPVLKERSSCPCGHVCTKGVMKGPGRQRVAKPKITSAATAVPMVTPQDEAAVNRAAMLHAAAVVMPNAFPQGVTLTIQTKPVPAQDVVFRRPLLAPSQAKSHLTASAEEAFSAQLEQFRPKKYCNRPGRTSRKTVALQRMAPFTLLPKAPEGMVLMPPHRPAVIGFAHPGTGMTVPVMPSTPLNVSPKNKNQKLVVKPHQPPNAVIAAGASVVSPQNSTFDAKAPISPPTITTLLGLNPDDLSLGAERATFKDVSLRNNESPSFVGLLRPTDEPESTVLLQPAEISPPMSPTQILKETDNQWLNSEVSDFSLSSFLGHLESPMKSSVSATNIDDSRMSQDVEAQFQSLMSENSMEFMTSFADLAAHISPDSVAANKK